MKKVTGKFKLRRDRYMSARGGTSSFYNIYCSHCRSWLLLYQKDGTGNIFRLYLDRIHAPESLVKLHKSDVKPKDHSGLTCNNCNTSIGVPMVYKPENRLAIRLVPGAIIRKKSDGTLPYKTRLEIKEVPDENSKS